MTLRNLALSLVVLCPWIACGGKSVLDVGSSGSGASGSTTSTTTTTTNTATTASGPSGCLSHDACPSGVCIFGTGQCSTRCSFVEPCPMGQVCDDCATSSCPGCADCMAACVPADRGQCDDHDDCTMGEVCLYGPQECAPACTNLGGCADPNLLCNPCATTSCPGCDDCLGACTESF